MSAIFTKKRFSGKKHWNVIRTTHTTRLKKLKDYGVIDASENAALESDAKKQDLSRNSKIIVSKKQDLQ